MVVLCACVALGVAAWLVPASIHIVSWGSSGRIGRVALFASPFYLRWALGIALFVALALWFLGPCDDEARGRRAYAVAPLSAVWAWGVPFLPWLPDRFPLLLVLAGPLRWIIAAAAAVAVCMRIASGWEWRAPALPQLGRKTVFVASLAIYLLAGSRSLQVVGVDGDEPHYLVITQSLLLDHDLQIENNHQRGDYRLYSGVPLRPDYLTRGLNEQIYSIHAPGLPALLMPGYAAAGVWGAVATVALCGALAALALFELGGLIGGVRAGWVTWAGTCLTVPFVPHAWSIFPEVPAAAIVAWTMTWAAREGPASWRVWLWRGLCLATLPWLHTKFAVLLAGLALLLALRTWRRLPDLLALAVPIAVSVALWLMFFRLIYGSFDPQVAYGGFAGQFVRLANVPRSVVGALFDSKFGLFVYAPVLLAAPWGALQLGRERRWRVLAVASMGLAVAYVASSARFHMWWGGSSAPARLLVPVVPLLAPGLAAAFAGVRSRLGRAHMWAALVAGLGVSALSVAQTAPRLLFSDPHGVARLAEWLGGGSPLAYVLPTFTEEQWLASLWMLVRWSAAALGAAALAWWLERLLRRSSMFWVCVTEGVAFWMLAALVAGPTSATVHAETVRRGRFALLDKFEPAARRGFDYRAGDLTGMSAARWLESGSLTFSFDSREPPDSQGRLTEGLSLPAGDYDVSVLFRDGAPHAGDLIVSGPGGHMMVRTDAGRAQLVTVRLQMPVAVPDVQVRMSNPAGAAAVRRVEIVPRAIQPRSVRLQRDIRSVDSVPGRPGAYMAYLDRNAFPEGGVFWTHSTDAAEVAIATAGAPSVNLTIYTGPKAGVVQLVVDGRASDVAVGPGETRVLTMAVAPSNPGYMLVRVQSLSAFSPAEVDHQSSDTRLLGCQVRVEVAD